jgi:hypothetical protein
MTTVTTVAGFKEYVVHGLGMKLNQWKLGKNRWTVSTQFDEGILESALENVDGVEWDKMYNHYNIAEFGEHRISIMDYARYITTEFDEAESNLCDFINGQN